MKTVTELTCRVNKYLKAIVGLQRTWQRIVEETYFITVSIPERFFLKTLAWIRGLTNNGYVRVVIEIELRSMRKQSSL